MNEIGDVGPGGCIHFNRIIAVATWKSEPIRRLARKAREEGLLIDLTYGYACKWVFFMDSGHVVLGTQRHLKKETENDD
ncbi:MAG: DUF370 domain-containing protein [Anaerolineae bacterium]|jgi:regulator of extracellular matrix RemA (YlzA/DUF370 family)|nr:DUF370 domain-containing protein [Anaerolineae bacterium]MBT7074945.1 DUF370 domain-containing protein [Anaerolineae bacterium]